MTFHNKLGSQAQRIDRIATLARELAPIVGADADLAERAARFVKADLSSEMVYEFPELQGLMGKYYAGPAGHPLEVAEACVEHYQPLGPSDDVPSAPVSVAVALADKLDLLTGFWAIDEKPTGSKDPFALRRAALGVIRLVLENDVRLTLDDRLDAGVYLHWQQKDRKEREGRRTDRFEAAKTLGVPVDTLDEKVREFRAKPAQDRSLQVTSRFNDLMRAVGVGVGDAISNVSAGVSDALSKIGVARFDSEVDDLLAFFHDRLKVFLRDRGIRHDVIDACLAMPGNDDLTLLVKRAEALSEVLKTEDGENLIQGYKRAANILSQAEEKDGVEYSYGADAKFAENDAEKALFAALDTAEAAIAPALQDEDFAAAMGAMADLRGPIDAFFEAVVVNAESAVLRRNRLNLLSRIRATCGQVADLTRVEG